MKNLTLLARLHRGQGGLYYSYAQLKCAEQREKAFLEIPEFEAHRQLREYIAEFLRNLSWKTSPIIRFCPKRNKHTCPACKICGKKCIFISTETVGGASVSSGCWGEDSNYGLAGAAHSHVASPALTFYQPVFSAILSSYD